MEKPDGEAIFNGIRDSRLPIFEVIDRDNQKHYKIYLNGKIEGFGSTDLGFVNWIRAFIGTQRAIDLAAHQTQFSTRSSDDGSGASVGTAL